VKFGCGLKWHAAHQQYHCGAMCNDITITTQYLSLYMQFMLDTCVKGEGMAAEMGCTFIKDRQRAGIEAAKAKGTYKG
jgi:hypothetical protein